MSQAWAADLVRDELVAEIEREVGRLRLEQVIAIERAIERYRELIERLPRVAGDE